MSSIWALGLISQRCFFLSGYFFSREVGLGAFTHVGGCGVRTQTPLCVIGSGHRGG